jgi:hypothetical protein
LPECLRVPAAKTSLNGGARLSSTVTVAVLCVLVSMASFTSLHLIAAGGCRAVHSMAEILLNVTNVPTVPQKAMLQGILVLCENSAEAGLLDNRRVPANRRRLAVRELGPIW